ncbi:MAG: fibronectin type III domain-containing protein, partial [Flavobacteriaceae bacterium]|nr:fibronectin type III domain-containing protein [Flavobacteriaceae bacterium]
MIKYPHFFLFLLIFNFNINAQNDSHPHEHKHGGLHHWEIPSKDPDRIILTFNGDPSTKRAVTWRTDLSVENSEAQIAVAGVNSSFANEATSYIATTERFDLGLYKSNKSLVVNYHSVVFENLKPNTLY